MTRAVVRTYLLSVSLLEAMMDYITGALPCPGSTWRTPGRRELWWSWWASCLSRCKRLRLWLRRRPGPPSDRNTPTSSSPASPGSRKSLVWTWDRHLVENGRVQVIHLQERLQQNTTTLRERFNFSEMSHVFLLKVILRSE